MIENYKEAIESDDIWVCHHRLETHTSNGLLRQSFLSVKEMKALGMYYNRPACELIFLPSSEHSRLHNAGKKVSLETRKKLSISHTGQKAWNVDKMMSSISKEKNRESHLGKHHSEETKAKMRASHTLCPTHNFSKAHWKIVDGKRVWYD